MAGEKKLDDLKLGASLSRLGIRGRSGSGTGLTRLGSLKPARDLTLGSTPKRTFVPNIPVRRTVKEEPASDKSEAAGSSKKENEKRNRDRTPTRGRGRGRGRGELVMSQSIFSQGPFALNRTGSGSGENFASSFRKSSNANSSGEARSRGSVIREERGEVEEGDESRKILEMLYESGRMDVDDEEIRSGGLMPVTIPLTNSKLVEEESIRRKHGRIKLEENDDIEMANVDVGPKVNEKRKFQVTCDQLFSANTKDEKLLFLQFPDALPIKPLSHETTAANESEATTNTPSSNSEEEPQKFSFKNVSEGYIGKLVVHKSGKVRMLLGHASLNVDMGTPCGFLQDLMAIHLEDDRKEMVCLGHIDHKIVCVPDFEELVGNAAT